MGPFGETVHYSSKINGAAFTAEVGFRQVKFWLADLGKRRIVRISDLRSVRIQPNGYTKLVLRLQKDLLVPTSQHEAPLLTKALNAVLAERRATEHRREVASRESLHRHALYHKQTALLPPGYRKRLPRGFHR